LPTLLKLALDSPDSGWQPEDGPKDEIVQFIISIFLKRTEMLKEYFRMDIDENANLLTLPQIFDNYVPDMDGLPQFALALGGCDWQDEQRCFQTISQELAEFYSFRPPQRKDLTPSATSEINDEQSYMWKVEHVLFPALRNFDPPKEFSNDGTVIQVACLDRLYKIFERC